MGSRWTQCDKGCRNAGNACGHVQAPSQGGEKLRQIGEDGVAKIRATGAPVENAKAAWFKDGEVSVLCRFDDAEAEGQTFLERCRVAFDGIKPAKLRKPPERTDANKLTVYPIVDHHIGMRCWEAETGEDYGLDDAVERLISTTSDLVRNAPSSKVAHIVNMGDFYDVDDSRNETPASKHKLDVGGRYFDIIDAGVRATAALIDMALQKHEYVVYRALRGNHDMHSHIVLPIALRERYRKEPRVTIDMGGPDYHLIIWGKCMAMCHHGDKGKPERMVGYMSDRYAANWGKSFWRFLWTGHYHTEASREINGAYWQGFRTASPGNAYTHSNAYSGRQSMYAITLDKESGDKGIQKENIMPPWALQCVS